MSEKILKFNLFLIAVITFVHLIALNFYLYWHLWWLDIVMHFLGGFWVASFVLWVFIFSGFWSEFKNNSPFLIALLLTCLIALGWEIYETKFGITFTIAKNYWSDTVSDLFVSFSGALLSVLWIKNILRKTLR